jgi:hypothetical protein
MLRNSVASCQVRAVIRPGDPPHRFTREHWSTQSLLANVHDGFTHYSQNLGGGQGSLKGQVMSEAVTEALGQSLAAGIPPPTSNQGGKGEPSLIPHPSLQQQDKPWQSCPPNPLTPTPQRPVRRWCLASHVGQRMEPSGGYFLYS